jgi:hypothetical protein
MGLEGDVDEPLGQGRLATLAEHGGREGGAAGLKEWSIATPLMPLGHAFHRVGGMADLVEGIGRGDAARGGKGRDGKSVDVASAREVGVARRC